MLSARRIAAIAVLACSPALAAPEPPAVDPIDPGGAPPALSADFNRGGIVDIYDLSLFIDYWCMASLKADFNGDGQLDVTDFFLYVEAFLKAVEPSPAVGASPVAE